MRHDQSAIAIRAQRERVEAEASLGPAKPTEKRKLIAARITAKRWRRSVLLRRQLQSLARAPPPPEETAVHVRLLVAGADVGPRIGCRAIDTPCARVDAHFGRAPLDA